MKIRDNLLHLEQYINNIKYCLDRAETPAQVMHLEGKLKVWLEQYELVFEEVMLRDSKVLVRTADGQIGFMSDAIGVNTEHGIQYIFEEDIPSLQEQGFEFRENEEYGIVWMKRPEGGCNVQE